LNRMVRFPLLLIYLWTLSSYNLDYSTSTPIVALALQSPSATPINPTVSSGGIDTQPVPATLTNTSSLATQTATLSNFVIGSTISHQVVKGEWLMQIARCYGADFNAVRKANPQIYDPNEISPSTILTVPNIGSNGAIYGPPCVGYHTVQQGDTWSSIAQTYNADTVILQAANRGTLSVGKVLLVPLNSAQPSVPPMDNSFIVRSYGGKCLDFGSAPPETGAPVFISECNGTAGQRIEIVEIDPTPISRHEVVLFAGNNKVIGAMLNIVGPDIPLELQDYKASAGQIFELDGDSIILAANRDLVVEVHRSRNANHTPLILGYRDLDDAEFWRITASDRSELRPTRGFIRISQDKGELHAQYDFLKAVGGARWGTVIELDPDVSIDLTNLGLLSIRAGVTIRGDRHGTSPGPELWTSHAPNNYMLEMAGNDVRITGLRLRGPSRSLDLGSYLDRGIMVHSQYKTIIDHNELSDWPIAAIEVTGDGILDDPTSQSENVLIKRNFIHHNRGEGFGYGVVTGYSGYAHIVGNTFVENRHAIAGDGTENSGYGAWFNLVLSATPDYKPNNPFYGYGQDFDMHGTGNDPCTHCGGIAGEYIEIARNTFFGVNRENFHLRGTPTYMAEFHHNIVRGSRAFAIKTEGDPPNFYIYDNQFFAPHPARHLGIGDFDGDGKQDLFMATGTAWYYSSAGKAEWRYLNAHTDTINKLLFGDFDADGRTDVFTQHDYNWDVSWGGASRWEHINVSGTILGDAAIGDFIGDERDDVFYSDGQTWHVSDGGVGQFTHLNTSGYRVSRLRFGDFNADGKTDVFSVVDGQWKASYSGLSSWQFLRPKLTDSVARLTVADFNGDGRADVATSTKIDLPLGSDDTYDWKVSFGGTEPWTALGEHVQSLDSVAAIGRFDTIPDLDVLVWHNKYLTRLSLNTGNSLRHSREDMR
jgi:hypothetical protein